MVWGSFLSMSDLWYFMTNRPPSPPGRFALSISDRPRPSGQFLVLGRVRTLASWFVHFLAQFDNVKKQASHGTLSQTSEWYIWCIYSLLEECRPYVFVSIVHQKRKIGSEKSTPRCPFDRKEASLTPHIENPMNIGRFIFCLFAYFIRLTIYLYCISLI